MLACCAGCSTPLAVDDPVKELNTPEQTPRRYMGAIESLKGHDLTEEERQVLRGMMYRPGYTPEVREAALNLLEQRDKAGLFETIGLRLPRLDALQWRRRLCEIIAERGWTDLSQALVRAWAIPMPGWVDSETDRPEYLALARLYGRDRVIDQVFQMLVESNTVALQGFRRAAWTLLHRLGQRERLTQLLQSVDESSQDAMLIDLKAGATELGIVPANYEEILWVRTLRQPAWATFWTEAASVIRALPPASRATIELRDLPILVAASKHEPELLTASRDDLYQRVDGVLRGRKRHMGGNRPGAYEGYIGTNDQYLNDHRDKLTWGDLAAMLLAMRALSVPEVVNHLFDYAERDRADKSTEYGGLIRLDEKHRFEVIEFIPRVRYHDNRFESSPAMIEAGYGAVFHFHFHVQRHDNAQYAGPGLGDLDYAQNVRANCLVFTSVDRRTMNVDFYRHDRVVVDLGEIKRAD